MVKTILIKKFMPGDIFSRKLELGSPIRSKFVRAVLYLCFDPDSLFSLGRYVEDGVILCNDNFEPYVSQQARFADAAECYFASQIEGGFANLTILLSMGKLSEFRGRSLSSAEEQKKFMAELAEKYRTKKSLFLLAQNIISLTIKEYQGSIIENQTEADFIAANLFVESGYGDSLYVVACLVFSKRVDRYMDAGVEVIVATDDQKISAVEKLLARIPEDQASNRQFLYRLLGKMASNCLLYGGKEISAVEAQRRAEVFFKKSGTPLSFALLGDLYLFGELGKGMTKEALLGSIRKLLKGNEDGHALFLRGYAEYYLDGPIDKAKKYFSRSSFSKSPSKQAAALLSLIKREERRKGQARVASAAKVDDCQVEEDTESEEDPSCVAVAALPAEADAEFNMVKGGLANVSVSHKMYDEKRVQWEGCAIDDVDDKWKMKVELLIGDILQGGRLGKVKMRKGALRQMSRRITKEHRLFYYMKDGNVHITNCVGH